MLILLARCGSNREISFFFSFKEIVNIHDVEISFFQSFEEILKMHTLSPPLSLCSNDFHPIFSPFTFLAAVKSMISLFLCEGNNSSIS